MTNPEKDSLFLMLKMGPTESRRVQFGWNKANQSRAHRRQSEDASMSLAGQPREAAAAIS
jgi:hypothetical protein